MNTAAKLIAGGALAIVLPACGARQAGGEGPAEGEPAFEVTIEVENQNFYDARIYRIEFGRRTRLGNVPGNSTRVFRFRSEPTEVQFLIDFIGSGDLTTTGVEVRPGDELVLTLTANTHRLRFRS
ncbi:MAG: hypothetical protein GTO22_17345 [Gemmatimonadales bacterium]|nr:hypothetical protein [Gemmatimonadales bacterium]